MKKSLLDKIGENYYILHILSRENELLRFFFRDKNGKTFLKGDIKIRLDFLNSFNNGMPKKSELRLSPEEYEKERLLIAHENYLKTIEGTIEKIIYHEYLN